jgi:hypothetical protein
MTASTLRRYSNLPATLHILQNRSLSLLSPNNWDDRNDAFYMLEYQKRMRASSVLALCFAEAPETYHHWRVFSPGSDGVCMEFDKEKLKEKASLDNRFKFQTVDYRTINSANGNGMQIQDLPFVKRFPYKDENEFRIIYVDQNELKEAAPLDISLGWIKRITLSPWMPEPLAEAVKTTMKSINGCRNIKVYRSTLVDNERWKQAALI